MSDNPNKKTPVEMFSAELHNLIRRWQNESDMDTGSIIGVLEVAKFQTLYSNARWIEKQRPPEPPEPPAPPPPAPA